MSNREQILQEALALPRDDREYVATALEESLTGENGESPDADVDAVISGVEFLAELQRRSAAYRAGTTTSRPADEVLADLTKRQTGGTKP
jgi:hypothetical protein